MKTLSARLCGQRLGLPHITHQGAKQGLKSVCTLLAKPCAQPTLQHLEGRMALSRLRLRKGIRPASSGQQHTFPP